MIPSTIKVVVTLREYSMDGEPLDYRSEGTVNLLKHRYPTVCLVKEKRNVMVKLGDTRGIE